MFPIIIKSIFTSFCQLDEAIHQRPDGGGGGGKKHEIYVTAFSRKKKSATTILESEFGVVTLIQ